MISKKCFEMIMGFSVLEFIVLTKENKIKYRIFHRKFKNGTGKYKFKYHFIDINKLFFKCNQKMNIEERKYIESYSMIDSKTNKIYSVATIKNESGNILYHGKKDNSSQQEAVFTAFEIYPYIKNI